MSIVIYSYHNPYSLKDNQELWDEIVNCPYFCVSQTLVNGLKTLYGKDFQINRVTTVKNLTDAVYRYWTGTACAVKQHADIDNIISMASERCGLNADEVENIRKSFLFNRNEVFNSIRTMFELRMNPNNIVEKYLTPEQKFIVFIFNEIINSNHQIVITSDKMPDELQGIEERLISRFKSGLSFGIDPPEFETAKAILEKKIENLGNTDLVITDDVLDFMVMNYCNDIRSLEGQLKRLFFCSIMEQTNYIDMNFASEVFKDQKTIKKAQEPLTKEFILKTTAEFYYLTISQIISKNRTRNLVTPREICMYLMRELLDVTFSEIGVTFSNRDHSTVMKACKRVETKIKKDPDYKLAVDKLKQKLGTL